MFPHLRHTAMPVLLCLLLNLGSGTALPQEPEKILVQITKAYSNLNSYRDAGQVTVITSDGQQTPAQTARTAFERPDKLRIEAEDLRVSLSEKSLKTVMDTLRTTLEQAVVKMPEADELLVGPLGSALLGSPKGQPQAILLHLLMDRQPAKWLTREGKVTVEQPQEWSGKSWNRLKVDRPLRPDWLIWYNPENFLVGRLDVVSGDSSKKTAKVQWTAGEITTKALPQSIWTLDIPANYTSVDKKVAEFQKAAVEKKKTPESELVGKSAGDFPLELIGTDGKTMPVKLSDFKGKPVLIDFWATWCGPCRKSMPELTQALAALDEKSNLQVLLVSIDQKAEEGELTEFVRLGLKKMGIELEKLPRALLALDRTGAASKSLNVEAIPMTILIDRAGIIRKVHVGVTPTTTLRQSLAELMK